MSIRGRILFSVFCGLSVSSNPAAALGPALFGPEFTFAKVKMADGSWDAGEEDFFKLVKRLRRHLRKDQPKGATFAYSDSGGEKSRFAYAGGGEIKFTSPNGWWFGLGLDFGVIEFQMKPMTVKEFRKYKSDIQDAIFASAANEGFWPALFWGGGHINLSVSAFKDNPLLLRNFIVDLYNHNELFMGVFGYDTHNALPWNLLADKSKADFLAMLDTCNPIVVPPYWCFGKLDTIGIKPDDAFVEVWQGEGQRRFQKELAISLYHAFGGNGRIELRGVRPQTSMDVWLRQIDLINHRLKYLEKIREPIPIGEKVPIHKIDPEKHKLQPPVTPEKALRAFYQYVTESGLKWKNHRDYLWPKWLTDGELGKFEKSSWFKRRERSACEAELAANPE